MYKDQQKTYRVVRVVEGNVPVGTVEPDTVGQDLEDVCRTVVRLAVGCGKVVTAGDGVVPIENLLSVIVALLRQVQDEVGHFNVRLGNLLAWEVAVASRELDGNGQVLTLSGRRNASEGRDGCRRKLGHIWT